jgi:hypothetical protein
MKMLADFKNRFSSTTHTPKEGSLDFMYIKESNKKISFRSKFSEKLVLNNNLDLRNRIWIEVFFGNKKLNMGKEGFTA